MQLDSVEAVVRRCVAYSRELSADVSGTPAAIAEHSVRWLQRDEEEEELAPLTAIFEKMMRASYEGWNPSIEEFLTGVSNRYLASTAYLLPVFHHFSKSVVALARDQKRGAISLFLRDALFFWPPLAAHGPLDELPQIQFVRYTREEQRAAKDPRVFKQTELGAIEAGSPSELGNALLIDVGLYGTLISALFDKRHCTKDIGLQFMVSRNPYIAGWLNVEMGAYLLQDWTVQLPDLVNVADTIESLFKPFRMPIRVKGAEVEADLGSKMELAEIVTLCCAATFIWSVYRYSRSEWAMATTTVGDCLRELATAKKRDGAWYLRKAVTPWAEGQKFLRGWDHSFISPMDSIWCCKGCGEALRPRRGERGERPYPGRASGQEHDQVPTVRAGRRSRGSRADPDRTSG